jgi:signal peptidase I
VRRVVSIAAISSAVGLGLVLAALVLLLATGTLKAYAIPSSAMEPTLHCARPAPGCRADAKDRVLALTRFVSYERGDLVVFDVPPAVERRCGTGGTFVKRIVGLPGEDVELRGVRGRERVYVDREPLDEPYVQDKPRGAEPGTIYPVPDGSYFVLGDNRSESCDSRIFGPVPRGYLKGKLVATYWPAGRITIR